MQDVCWDLMTLKLRIMYLLCTSMLSIFKMIIMCTIILRDKVLIARILMKLLLTDASNCEPNGTWAILEWNCMGWLLQQPPILQSTSLCAVLYSEETIRTNCSWVQQSKPGALIYEPNHLWVTHPRTNERSSASNLSHSSTNVVKTWIKCPSHCLI